MVASEPLHHFVDDYLSFLYETHPTAATFDGVHQHDDLLENFERGAVEGAVQSLADWMKRGVWRSFESTRRARSSAGAYPNSACPARLKPSNSP